jgi:hypothetical protein
VALPTSFAKLNNVAGYACGPPGDDAIFVSCLFGAEQKKGIGSAVLEAILSDLHVRRAQAVETFAMKDSPNNPSGPLDFWLRKGFHIVREDQHFALVRKELG